MRVVSSSFDVFLCVSFRFLWILRGSSVMKRTVRLRTTWIWKMKYKHQRLESNINQQKPGTLPELFIYLTSKSPCRPPRFKALKRPTKNREKTSGKLRVVFIQYFYQWNHLHCVTLYAPYFLMFYFHTQYIFAKCKEIIYLHLHCVL